VKAWAAPAVVAKKVVVATAVPPQPLALLLLQRNALRPLRQPRVALTTWTTTSRSDQYFLTLCSVSCAIQPMRPSGSMR
jgi:hypothetical protein